MQVLVIMVLIFCYLIWQVKKLGTQIGLKPVYIEIQETGSISMEHNILG